MCDAAEHDRDSTMSAAAQARTMQHANVMEMVGNTHVRSYYLPSICLLGINFTRNSGPGEVLLVA